MELDLVVAAQQSALQHAISQVVGKEQLIENHVVLEHIRVLNRHRQGKEVKYSSGLLSPVVLVVPIGTAYSSWEPGMETVFGKSV